MTPKEYKQMMDYLTRSGIKNQVKFASDIARPDPKPVVKEIELFNAFNKRNPMAGGGRIGFMKGELVTQGPNTGKVGVKDLKLIKDKKGKIISRQTAYFKDMDAANAAIKKHKEGKFGQLKYKKSKKILNDPKLKAKFLKYAMGKDVTGKMIRKKYGLSNDEFFYGGLREIIDKDFLQYSKSQALKSKTIKNMLLLHNNKLSKDFIRNGLVVPDDIIEKLGLNTSEAATATARLSQHYSGMDFGFKELKSIRRNSKSGNKLFETMNKFSFGNPYRSRLYNISLQLIDDQLGNETGTFESLKKKASYILKKNKIKGFDINEIAGVTGTARTGVGEFSQFIDVMDSNLNQKQMASFQAAFSVARQNIKNNPSSFAKESKRINKLAGIFEREYGVKLPRIRALNEVEKFYSPKRLEELKNQGLDIKAASKKLGYTVQMPSGAVTISEFLKDEKIQKKYISNLVANSKLDKCVINRKADGGRIGFALSDECIRDGLNETKKKAAAGDKKAARQLVETAEAASKGGRLLKNILGPGAILGEAVFEGALIGNKVLGGKPADIAYAESYLSYLDPRKYSGQLDPLKMYREDMLESTADKDILRSGFAAQDQLSAFNKALLDRDIAKARGRTDQYLPAAADAREQGRFADQSADIISSEAFKDASNIAQEYLQGQEGQRMFPYNQFKQSIGRFESGEAKDFRRRKEEEMQNLYTQYSDDQIRSFLKQELGTNDDKLIDRYLELTGVTERITPAVVRSLSGLDVLRTGDQIEQAKQRVADAGGVANLARGGRAGFKLGTLRKGILKLIDDSVKSTPKDTTPELDKLIKKTLDEDFFDKKDRIIDTLNAKIARERKKFPYNQQVQEEPSQLEFYDDITKSNFRTKTGPFFDYQKRKNKAGGGLLKQAGDRSGPPPESGPMSQGLQGLMKRGMKI